MLVILVYFNVTSDGDVRLVADYYSTQAAIKSSKGTWKDDVEFPDCPF